MKLEVRSTQFSLKFANLNKKDSIKEFVLEYCCVASILCERLWPLALSKDGAPKFPNKSLTQVETWLSARVVQACAKQVAGIVNGTVVKNKRREFIVAKLLKAGEKKKARKLQEIVDKTKTSKPSLGFLEPQLDSRFFVLEKSSKKGCDLWLTLVGIGKKRGSKIHVPLRNHKHSLKLASLGKLKPSVRLSVDKATLAYKMPLPKKKKKSKTLGIDVGLNKGFTTSKGVQLDEINGWTMNMICEKLARKVQGSKAFARAQAHRKNYFEALVNRLNLENVSSLRIEKIRHLKRGRKSSRKISHWSYSQLLAAVKSKASLLGVQVEEVNPAFTSQRCSKCGWVRKTNRKGEHFKCGKCGFTHNADVNAAINISLRLLALPEDANSSKGFLWAVDHEPIVHDARKAKKKTCGSSANDFL